MPNENNVLPMTKAELDDQLKEMFGKAMAEQRAAFEAMGKELEAKARAGQPGFVNPAATPVPGTIAPGGKMARILASLAAGDGDHDKACQYAEKHWGKGPEMDGVYKTMQAGDFDAGGALIVESDVLNDYIEILKPQAVVRSFGPRPATLVGGSATMGKLTGSPTARYRGENVANRASQNTVGNIRLLAKELIVTVPISNKLLRYGTNVEAIVRQDALSQHTLREDLAFIRGTGSVNEPKGLRYLAASGNVFDANGTVNHANVVADMGKAKLKLEEANVGMVKPGWLFAPRTRNYLEHLLTSDGNNYAFRAEILAGSLAGNPFRTTTQIPTNLGGGSNESEVYLADFAHVVVGDALSMTVEVSREATYMDANGNLQSAFANGETVIQITAEHDIGLRHDEAVAVLTAVKWGV